MLDKKVADLLNEQINKEFYSAYLYMDFANYYADEGLDGFRNWYEVQAKEERDHAIMMRAYLIDNGVRVKFDKIAAPDAKLKEFMDPLKAGLEHERYVTSLIAEIYNAAAEAKDYKTMQFLDWFVKEQGEEEKNAEELIKKMVGRDLGDIYNNLDRDKEIGDVLLEVKNLKSDYVKDVSFQCCAVKLSDVVARSQQA